MNIDRQIEFDKVKEMWADLAITDWAKEQIKEVLGDVEFFDGAKGVAKHAREVLEERNLLANN